MADDVIPLSRFAPAALAGRRAGRRLDAILADPDPPARVAALPVQDLYFLVQEVGLADARQLVELATPEQFQGLIDLSSWSHDRLDPEAVVPWLEAVAEASPEKLAADWRELDPELAALLFQRWVRVYDIVEGEVPDWEEPPFIPTPDRFFVLKVIAERAGTVRLVEQLVDRLYRVDPELARHTLRAASSEPTAELEEMSHRWRSGRMQDLGYADFHEALEVYRPIDVASVHVGEGSEDTPREGTTLPVVLADPTLRQPFLARVLQRITQAAEAQRLEASLVLVLNRVLAANRVEPSDTAGITQNAALGAATLSLGLETVARGDEARGEEALRTIALARLHRVGYSVTRKLGELADFLAPRGGGDPRGFAEPGAEQSGAPFTFEEPLLSVLAALQRPRPEFPKVLDEPGGIGTRPFAEVADVRKVTHALGLLAAQITIVREGLGIDPAALGTHVTLGDVARTAIVHVVLGESPSATPLAVAAVQRFAASLEGGRIPDAAMARVREGFAALLAAQKIALPQEYDDALFGFRVDLERELGRLDTSAPPDKRFVGGLLLE